MRRGRLQHELSSVAIYRPLYVKMRFFAVAAGALINCTRWYSFFSGLCDSRQFRQQLRDQMFLD